VENMINELKAKLEELTRLEEAASKADDEMMADPTNEEKEKAFDVAYQNEFNAFIAVSEMIVKITSGKIDTKTAREIVRTIRNEIINLVA